MNMVKLSAAEYLCLKYPFKENYLKLITLAFQELYLKGIFNVTENYILIHKRDKRKRLRYSYSATDKLKQYTPVNLAEKFIIELLKSKTELQQHDLKQYFTNTLGAKVGKSFKSKLILQSLKEKKISKFKLFRNSTQNKYLKKINTSLNSVEKGFNEKTMNISDELIYKINELETLICLLTPETMVKISALNNHKILYLDRLETNFFTDNNFKYLNTFLSSSANGNSSLANGYFGQLSGSNFNKFP